MGTMLAINGNVINSQEPLPIPVELMTKLWENPNPTSSFASQNITLASDDYDFLLWVSSIGSTKVSSTIMPKGKGCNLEYSSASSGGSGSRTRSVTYTSDTIYAVADAYEADGTTAAIVNNNRCIPLVIYGFKKQIPMNNVSTGPTLLGSVTSDGVKTYSQLFDSLFAACANVNDNAYLKFDNGNYTYVFRLSSKDPASYRFCSTWGVSGTKTRTETIKITSSGSVYYKQTEGVTADGSSTVAEAGYKFELYNL